MALGIAKLGWRHTNVLSGLGSVAVRPEQYRPDGTHHSGVSSVAQEWEAYVLRLVAKNGTCRRADVRLS